MAGEIIRQGDKTTHGATVIEGSPTDICHGKGVALAGIKTACGAVLVAGQFTDTAA